MEDTGAVFQVGLGGLVPTHDDDGNMAGLRTGVEFPLHISTAHTRKVQV
jgi:hypothetical protein